MYDDEIHHRGVILGNEIQGESKKKKNTTQHNTTQHNKTKKTGPLQKGNIMYVNTGFEN